MVCLETTFIIDLLRKNENVGSILDKYKKSQEEIFIATPSIMEIVKGAYLRFNSEIEAENIRRFLFAVNILDFDQESAFKAGEIEANLRKKGEIIDLEDIMIAAIALKNNQRLITNNVKHFERIKGLQVEGY